MTKIVDARAMPAPVMWDPGDVKRATKEVVDCAERINATTGSREEGSIR
jgi:hypothetical protein